MLIQCIYLLSLTHQLTETASWAGVGDRVSKSHGQAWGQPGAEIHYVRWPADFLDFIGPSHLFGLQKSSQLGVHVAVIRFVHYLERLERLAWETDGRIRRQCAHQVGIIQSDPPRMPVDMFCGIRDNHPRGESDMWHTSLAFRPLPRTKYGHTVRALHGTTSCVSLSSNVWWGEDIKVGGEKLVFAPMVNSSHISRGEMLRVPWSVRFME